MIGLAAAVLGFWAATVCALMVLIAVAMKAWLNGKW